jgi:hypothetical protein
MIKRPATRLSDDAAKAMPFDLEAPAHVQPTVAVNQWSEAGASALKSSSPMPNYASLRSRERT